jgi:hypothetical protein
MAFLDFLREKYRKLLLSFNLRKERHLKEFTKF